MVNIVLFCGKRLRVTCRFMDGLVCKKDQLSQTLLSQANNFFSASKKSVIEQYDTFIVFTFETDLILCHYAINGFFLNGDET